MNVLLIGSGGREHAMAWKLVQSPLLETLYCAPGNAGIAQVAECVALDISDHQQIIEFCQDKDISFVIIGPEGPLVAGIIDALEAADISAFGPSAAAAQLEGSKGFTKDLCAEFNIPTAAYQRFNNAPKAKRYVREMGAPIVIKADGLAAGKGVIMAMSVEEALDAIDDCFEGAFGDAGYEVVVEEFLEGEEASLFAFCDGQTALLMGTAQDHKRVGEGDTGPNTGGMGAYSPATIMDQAMIDEVMGEIIVPTLAGMHSRGIPFKGILFAGLMLTEDGPQLIEYNVRFGDPETQVILPRLKSDLLELMIASVENSILEVEAEWRDETALTVVLASKGYPGSYEKGTEIRDLDKAEADNIEIFHAGTAENDGKLTAIGGRVLNITAMGSSVSEAQADAYAAIKKIDWPNGFCRSDIGWRAVAREKE
ncbi:MAG: phosphoribosylamine--glycine ligase [Hyphomicrobiales bacterium]|nr:MAG: phosphoribosylamine--glycine ligase [Hyphomicrobiales bacterium]